MDNSETTDSQWRTETEICRELCRGNPVTLDKVERRSNYAASQTPRAYPSAVGQLGRSTVVSYRQRSTFRSLIRWLREGG